MQGRGWRHRDAHRPIYHNANLLVCVADAAGRRLAFLPAHAKGPEQEGLTGVKGSVLRKVADKTRSGLESALASIKKTSKQSAGAE